MYDDSRTVFEWEKYVVTSNELRGPVIQTSLLDSSVSPQSWASSRAKMIPLLLAYLCPLILIGAPVLGPSVPTYYANNNAGPTALSFAAFLGLSTVLPGGFAAGPRWVEQKENLSSTPMRPTTKTRFIQESSIFQIRAKVEETSLRDSSCSTSKLSLRLRWGWRGQMYPRCVTEKFYSLRK